MRLIRLAALSMLLSASLIGCASIQVGVSGLAKPEVANVNSYVLFPLNKNVELDDLQFAEYAAYVDAVLRQRGWVPRQAPLGTQLPDVLIFVGWGVGDPQTHIGTHSTPIEGITGMGSVTQGGQTTYTPTYGTIGYKTDTYSYTTYTRYVILDAVSLRGKEVVPIFRTTIVSAGESGDLRRIFPYMITAARGMIGTNTGEMRFVEIDETDKAVRDLHAKIAGPVSP